MKQYEVWLVELPENNNHVYSGTRPAVIISNDKCNEVSPVVTIVPCSSKTQIGLPTCIRISKSSVAHCEQILTIPKEWLLCRLFRLDFTDNIKRGVRRQLNL